MNAPIVLFVYNRPSHTYQTLEALKINTLASSSELFIYSDAAKNEQSEKKVAEVREIIKKTTGFKNITIIERERNWGLANSVISGVTEVISKYGKAIVMEDDLISSSNFLLFMNNALNVYEEDNRIFSISGYSYPISIPSDYPHDVFLSYRGSSWGWAIWKNRWDMMDWTKDKTTFIGDNAIFEDFKKGGEDLPKMLLNQFSGKIDSWAIRFAYIAHKYNKVHILPSVSKIQNIGQDLSGIHSNRTTKYNVTIDNGKIEINLPKALEVNPIIVKRLNLFFKKNLVKSIIQRLKDLIKLKP